MNDLRPVCLTSIVFKYMYMEKIVLLTIKNETKLFMDSFQFAYKEKRSVEDATLILLNAIAKHLETPKCYARALFIDFSSAFNTIQPHLLAQKLLDMNVNVSIVSWVLDFMTDRRQFVKLNHTLSETVIKNTGRPKGSVTSPVLYTI